MLSETFKTTIITSDSDCDELIRKVKRYMLPYPHEKFDLYKEYTESLDELEIISITI